MENKVKEIISRFVELKKNEIKMEDELIVDLGMTSYDMICLLGEIEMEYDIEIGVENLKEYKTVADICRYMEMMSV